MTYSLAQWLPEVASLCFIGYRSTNVIVLLVVPIVGSRSSIDIALFVLEVLSLSISVVLEVVFVIVGSKSRFYYRCF